MLTSAVFVFVLFEVNSLAPISLFLKSTFKASIISTHHRKSFSLHACTGQIKKSCIIFVSLTREKQVGKITADIPDIQKIHPKRLLIQATICE